MVEGEREEGEMSATTRALPLLRGSRSGSLLILSPRQGSRAQSIHTPEPKTEFIRSRKGEQEKSTTFY